MKRTLQELIEDAENCFTLAAMDTPAGETLDEIREILDKTTRLKLKIEGLNQFEIDSFMRVEALVNDTVENGYYYGPTEEELINQDLDMRGEND